MASLIASVPKVLLTASRLTLPAGRPAATVRASIRFLTALIRSAMFETWFIVQQSRFRLQLIAQAGDNFIRSQTSLMIEHVRCDDQLVGTCAGNELAHG